MRGITKYSEPVAGTPSNYNLRVRFDLTDGMLGISQMHEGRDGPGSVDRVLLNKAQVDALLQFLGAKRS